MNNKQYTTEEIINRLKAGERITAIDGCNMPNGKDALIIGRTYEVKEYFGGGDFEIESEEYKCHEFDAEEFSQFFMFTSDYEAMKSEEKGDNETLHPLTETKQDIPEWLQRERVRFWKECFLRTDNTMTYEEASDYSDGCIEEFDKRFLNKDDDGSTTS